MQVSYLPLAFLVRPLLRTSFFERIGGKSVTDNNRLIDYAHSQAHMQTSAGYEEKGLSGRIDFLSHLVKAEDKKTGQRPTIPYLGTESLNMINAGADPFSSVLAGALFYFLHNPETLMKATEEVRYTISLVPRSSQLILVQFHISFILRDRQRPNTKFLHIPLRLYRRDTAPHRSSTQSPTSRRPLWRHNNRRRILPGQNHRRRAHVRHTQ